LSSSRRNGVLFRRQNGPEKEVHPLALKAGQAERAEAGVGKKWPGAAATAMPFLPSAGGFRSKNKPGPPIPALIWDFLALFRLVTEVAYPLLNGHNNFTRT